VARPWKINFQPVLLLNFAVNGLAITVRGADSILALQPTHFDFRLRPIGSIPMTENMSGSIFQDEAAARAWFEAARWPHGPVCPHCKWTKHYATKKFGVYRCADKTCMKDFTVITGTVMARSHVKLRQWAAAFHLAASSKSDFSARQLHRALGCHYNTARSMYYRVVQAMRRGSFELPSIDRDVARAHVVAPQNQPSRRAA
jgi:transposase-like protein